MAKEARKPEERLQGKTVLIVGEPDHSDDYQEALQRLGATVFYQQGQFGRGLSETLAKNVQAQIDALPKAPDLLIIHAPRMNQFSRNGFENNPAMQLAEHARKKGTPTLVMDRYPEGFNEPQQQAMQQHGITFRDSTLLYDQITPVAVYMINNKEKLTAGDAGQGSLRAKPKGGNLQGKTVLIYGDLRPTRLYREELERHGATVQYVHDIAQVPEGYLSDSDRDAGFDHAKTAAEAIRKLQPPPDVVVIHHPFIPERSHAMENTAALRLSRDLKEAHIPTVVTAHGLGHVGQQLVSEAGATYRDLDTFNFEEMPALITSVLQNKGKATGRGA